MRRALVLLGVLCAGRPLAAQAPPRATAGLSVASLTGEIQTGSASESRTGTGTGLELRFALPRVALHLRYLEGRLDANSAVGGRREFVDGEALLEYVPTPWLGVRLGPHARVSVTDGGRERWVLWEAKVRGEGALFESAVRSYVEVWRALSAELNVPDGRGTGHGGEVGMVVRLPRLPAWGRLGYRVERAKLRSGAQSETLEMLVVTLGAALR